MRRREILDYCRDWRTNADIAQRFYRTRQAAWWQTRKLAAQGLLEVHWPKREDRGRPPLMFRRV
jgi:predicted ArsR family transcriptional regulator